MAASENENDEDIEEEEVLLYADFDSVLDERMFQNNASFKIISLDSEEPFLQIGTQIYSGKWADTVGTHLFFESEESPPILDPVFSDIPKNTFEFKFKTRKCLELSRVFINKKEDDEELECSNSSANEVAPDTMEAMDIQESEVTEESAQRGGSAFGEAQSQESSDE